MIDLETEPGPVPSTRLMSYAGFAGFAGGGQARHNGRL